MTWLLVSWIGWTCPGGLLAGFWPSSAKPLVCQPKAETAIYTQGAQAYRKVREIGPGARLQGYQGLKGRDIPIRWTTTAEIEGER